MRINFKKLSYMLMALVIAITLVIGISNVFAKDAVKGKFENYKLGAMLEKDIKGEPKVNLSDKGKVTLPVLVDHSSDTPAVGDQGQQGSCVGWATSYYKGYQEKKDMSWGNVMFSPAFIYNQIVVGEDGGSYPSDAYELMMTLGNCKLSTMPYDDNDYTTQPNSTQLNEAENFKAESWGFLYDTGFNAAKTDSLKEYLQDDCLTISIPVYADFGTGFYDVATGTNYGGHALCVVGYDDSKSAFKFINSWGSDYGYSGYGYITYDLWDSFVTDNAVRSYGMVDVDSEPLPTPQYKYTLTFKDARVVEVGSHSAGNQWGVAVKNQSKSTTVMYKRQNTSNPITADKSIQTNYPGCYIGLHEYEANSANDDRANVIISNLHNGDNVIYLTCRDYQYTNYWSKWKFIINRTPN